MKKLLKIVIVSSISLLFSSCYNNKIIETIIPDVPVNQVVSFKNDIQPIFIRDGKNCTQCHNASIANPDLRVGNAYNALVPAFVTAGDAVSSALFNKAPGKDHPIAVGFTLSTDDFALIKAWIDRGAENN